MHRTGKGASCDPHLGLPGSESGRPLQNQPGPSESHPSPWPPGPGTCQAGFSHSTRGAKPHSELGSCGTLSTHSLHRFHTFGRMLYPLANRWDHLTRQGLYSRRGYVRPTIKGLSKCFPHNNPPAGIVSTKSDTLCNCLCQQYIICAGQANK